MARTISIPDYGDIYEDGVEEYAIPGIGDFNEDQAAGGNIYSVGCAATFNSLSGLIEIGDYPELLSTGISFLSESAEVADFISSALVQMGIAAGETEQGEFPENSSLTIILQGQTTGLTGLIVASSATLNFQNTVSEIADFIKSLDINFGLNAVVSEVVNFIESLSTGISISVSVSEAMDFIEGIEAALSFAPLTSSTKTTPGAVDVAVNFLLSALAYGSKYFTGIVHFIAEDITYRLIAKSKTFNFIAEDISYNFIAEH